MRLVSSKEYERLTAAAERGRSKEAEFKAYEQRLSKAFSRIGEALPLLGNAIRSHQPFERICWGGGWGERSHLSEFIDQYFDEVIAGIRDDHTVVVWQKTGNRTEYSPATRWERDAETGVVSVFLGSALLGMHTNVDRVFFEGVTDE